MSTGVRIVGLVRFPGYEVGEDGTVWSYWKRGGGNSKMIKIRRQLNPSIVYFKKDPDRKHPYLKIVLRKNGKPYNVLVHTLVLEAFDKPRPPGKECRHKDGNGLNNYRNNLWWGTHFQNMDDRDLHGTTAKGSRNGQSRLMEEDIPEIRLLLANKFTYETTARYYSVTQSTIRRIDKGETWKHVA